MDNSDDCAVAPAIQIVFVAFSPCASPRIHARQTALQTVPAFQKTRPPPAGFRLCKRDFSFAMPLG